LLYHFTGDNLQQFGIAKRAVEKDRKLRGHDQRRAKNSVNQETNNVPMKAGRITL
jgi:hypothetical protein